MKILAIIPARGGSKGIKYKNIKLFRGKPLIYWSIKIAKECKYISRVICSTDSKNIANIAKENGAEVPFLRPKDISGDLSTDLEFTEHCLDYLGEKEGYKPDIIVHLRPTYPTRKLKILNDTINIFINNINNYDSLRTVIEFEKSPFKMYTINNNKLKPLFKSITTNNTNNINNTNNTNNIIYEPYNRCRQELPKTYLHNGYIDIIKYNTIRYKKSITGDIIYPYLMNKSEYNDIDTNKDWIKAENKII